MTFGSPHQGVFGVPECQAWVGDPVLGPALCELVRRLLNMGAYIPWIQVTYYRVSGLSCPEAGGCK